LFSAARVVLASFSGMLISRLLVRIVFAGVAALLVAGCTTHNRGSSARPAAESTANARGAKAQVAQVWRTSLRGFSEAVSVGNVTLMLGTSSDQIYLHGLDSKTGKPLWKNEI
jgi:hypothetical protein